MSTVDVYICEVGPRDGLQNAHHLMPTAAKKVWISALAAATYGLAAVIATAQKR